MMNITEITSHFNPVLLNNIMLNFFDSMLMLHVVVIAGSVIAIAFFINMIKNNNMHQKSKLEETIELRTMQYKQELERAERNEKHKEEFMASMSHEMRTPLNAVVGMTNLLLNTAVNEHQQNYLRIIKESSDSLLRMINNILDLAKMEANKIELEKINFNLQKVIGNVKDILGLKAEEKKIQLKFETDPSIPDVIIGDPTRLNQVLMNLTCNAIKFTERGSVTVSVKLKSLIDDQMHLSFAVRDTGIGIAEDKLNSVFESFTQAGCEISRKYGGTGLGLSICKKLVELQGGKINVSSKPGVGSEFQFDLSFGLATSTAASLAVNADSKQFLDNLNVLVVEDNPFNQSVASDTLQNFNENINVDIAANGKAAIEKIENNEYDVVLMDVQMPVMGGIEATEHIRRNTNETKKNVPIIALTANASANEAEKCRIAGMNEFISKPFEPLDLFLKILKVSDRKRIRVA